MIEFEKVSKTYHGATVAAEHVAGQGADAVTRRPGVPVLCGASLTIEAGSFTAVTGRSGSGKSTLLNLAGGLDTADSGRVTVAGTTLQSLSADALADFRLRTIGIVFQFFNLLPTLTLRQNVALPGLLKGLRGRALEARVDECLHTVGLVDVAARFPHETSGGEIQRAAIARAVLNKPKVLLADEPTGNLDSENADDVFDLFERLAREHGATLLVVTHDQELTARADAVYSLHGGLLERQR